MPVAVGLPQREFERQHQLQSASSNGPSNGNRTAIRTANQNNLKSKQTDRAQNRPVGRQPQRQAQPVCVKTNKQQQRYHEDHNRKKVTHKKLVCKLHTEARKACQTMPIGSLPRCDCTCRETTCVKQDSVSRADATAKKSHVQAFAEQRRVKTSHRSRSATLQSLQLQCTRVWLSTVRNFGPKQHAAAANELPLQRQRPSDSKKTSQKFPNKNVPWTACR